MSEDQARDEVDGRRDRVAAARAAAVERAGAAIDRAGAAREAAMGRAGEAREAAANRAGAAREAAGEAIRSVKPRFRGVSHEWAFFFSLGLGVSLIVLADTPRKTLAVGIYALTLSALFGVSALYHRIDWKRNSARMLMRRLDHSTIFLSIAGTVTPFALLVMHGVWADAILIAVWAAALIGITVEVLWVTAPKWANAIVYIAVGWVGALAFPQIVGNAGAIAGLLIASGGALYTAGAFVYASERPNPNPAVFGYHEIFHLLVIAAAGLHFAAIAFFAL